VSREANAVVNHGTVVDLVVPVIEANLLAHTVNLFKSSLLPLLEVVIKHTFYGHRTHHLTPVRYPKPPKSQSLHKHEFMSQWKSWTSELH